MAYNDREFARATRNLFVPYMNERDYMGKLRRNDSDISALCKEQRHRKTSDQNLIRFKKFQRSQMMKRHVNIDFEEKVDRKTRVFDYTPLSNVKLVSMFSLEDKQASGKLELLRCRWECSDHTENYRQLQ